MTMPTKLSPQQRAKLRVCASCEWIYEKSDSAGTCPKCEFVSYGARFVYGDAAYRHKFTQKPWLDRKMSEYERKLLSEIVSDNPFKKEIPIVWPIPRGEGGR